MLLQQEKESSLSNYHGIYFENKVKRFTDPLTGAHFDYFDVVRKLEKISEKQKNLIECANTIDLIQENMTTISTCDRKSMVTIKKKPIYNIPIQVQLPVIKIAPTELKSKTRLRSFLQNVAGQDDKMKIKNAVSLRKTAVVSKNRIKISPQPSIVKQNCSMEVRNYEKSGKNVNKVPIPIIKFAQNKYFHFAIYKKIEI